MRGKKMDGFPPREQALADFFAAWEPNPEQELIPLAEASRRITAEELRSVNTLPVYRVSGCDGIAVDSARFQNGMPDYSGWREGQEFARADTGDDFADCYDAVIPIEETDLTPEGRIAFISPDITVNPGCNVQPRGSTIREGDLLMRAGLPIRPTDLALLAMGGISMVPVIRRPRVAFIPTGSELVSQGTIPKRGETVDTNSILVRNMLLRFGAEPLIFPIVPDNRELLAARLREALHAADIVIMNAGTARGSEDFNFGLVGREGRLIHHYIAAAPGRPMGLAVADGKPIINLPGPTMAAFFGMDWCVRAVVARWLGVPVKQRERIRGVLMEEIRCTPHMAILQRLRAEKLPDGTFRLYPLSFKSGQTAAALGSNALYVSEIGESRVEKGTVLEAELLRSMEYIGVEE